MRSATDTLALRSGVVVGADRLRLIQSLDRVDLPESVPGLIKVAERETSWELAGAAEALATYKDRRAVPVLKESLNRENDEHHRRSIVNALVELKGLTAAEVVSTVEAYAVQISTAQGLRNVKDATATSASGKPLPAVVSLGYHVCCMCPSMDDAALLLLRRDELEQSKPDVAQAIRDNVETWPGKAADVYLLDRIRDGKADAARFGRRCSGVRASAPTRGTACGRSRTVRARYAAGQRSSRGNPKSKQRCWMAMIERHKEPCLPVPVWFAKHCPSTKSADF